MYVCMCVCMYVCIYVYVCMYVCIYVIVINRARFYSEVTSTEARGSRFLLLDYRTEWAVYNSPRMCKYTYACSVVSNYGCFSILLLLLAKYEL